MIKSEVELAAFFDSCEKHGIYYERIDGDASELTPDEVSKIHRKKVYDRLGKWLELAEEKLEERDRIIAVTGNDDTLKVDDILRQSSRIRVADLEAQNIDGHFDVLGYNYSTPTPWNTAKEKSDQEIGNELASVTYSKGSVPLILNFHVPPKGIGLDSAVALDKNLKPIIAGGGPEMINIGSDSVHEFVKRVEPSLGLFGHVHEAKGISKIHETICINPGSVYYEGNLQGCICRFENGQLTSWQLTEG